MFNKIFRWFFTIFGAFTGYALGEAIVQLITGFNVNQAVRVPVLTGVMIICGLIWYLISPLLLGFIRRINNGFLTRLQNVSIVDIIISISGLIIGLLIAVLVTSSFDTMVAGGKILPVILMVITVFIYVVCATLSVNLALRKKYDILSMFTSLRRLNRDKRGKYESKTVSYQPKILDTSVIIDGRIFDILKTGFVDGPIVIPGFVLEELRHIADSSDVLKRTRGRRGLDILNQIQKELSIPVEISEKDFDNIQEVDSKLLKLAQVMGGKILTNDFNLNKVAEFQGVSVLNINELANAVKPVVIPGEEMHINVIKDGKESNQGVAYLDDGTMIVVEGGRRYVGEFVEVVVTSVLQTAAGRMIFARLKTAQEKAV